MLTFLRITFPCCKHLKQDSAVLMVTFPISLLRLQISLFGRGCGELLEFSAHMGESRLVPSSRGWGETPPQTNSQAAGPQPGSRPAQESHAVWLPYRKDGEQT